MSTHLILGAGPLGLHLAHQLVATGHAVGLVSRRGTTVGGAVTIAADLLDTSYLQRQVTTTIGVPDTMYFVAQPAYTTWPEQFPPLHDAAITLAASFGSVLVAAENTYAYGPVDGPIHEQLPLVAATRKGSTRAQMTRTLFAAHEDGSIRATAGRASDFFGPEVLGSVLGSPFFGPLLGGGPLPVLASADQPHSWTYISDFATAMIELGSDERALGRAWHVPCVETSSLRELADRVADLIGRDDVKIAVMPVQDVHAIAAEDPMMNELVELLYEFDSPYIVDTSAFMAIFKSQPTDLQTALAETVAWFSSNGGRQ